MVGDIAVVGEARTGRETVAEAERLRPDAALMDTSMPELDGVEACRCIRQVAPAVSVLFLTMHEAEEYFFCALQAGAAVPAVARGESLLSPNVARALVADYSRHSALPPDISRRWQDATSDSYASLASRERAVPRLVGEGCTNQEVADRLHISIKTVQSHRDAVMEKLGLRDVTRLVRYAVRGGLVDPERESHTTIVSDAGGAQCLVMSGMRDEAVSI